MSILFIKDLVFFGVHGTTGREKLDPQRFNVGLNIEVDTLAAEKSDLLSDTYDYKIAEAIVKEIIEGEHCVLIETLASHIAEKICKHPKVQSAKVTISKIDAGHNGSPGISLFRKRIIQEESL